MIFSIQRYLEDSFSRRGLDDPDQYAVNFAKLYDRHRAGVSIDEFLESAKRIRTAFYRSNSQVQRPVFERELVKLLDSKFKKKDCYPERLKRKSKSREAA